MPDKSDSLITTAEVIYEKPVSGAFTEIPFGSDRDNTLWVKFSDHDGIVEWIGKFGCGLRTMMRVTPARAPGSFFINAGGFAYVVNATRRQLLNHHCDPFTEDIVYDATTDHFIAADVHLRIIEAGREIWTSPRIALDGIYDLSIDGRLLTGRVVVGYEGETALFALDLDAREFLKAPGIPLD